MLCGNAYACVVRRVPGRSRFMTGVVSAVEIICRDALFSSDLSPIRTS